MKAVARACLLAVLLGTCGAHAQVVYKSTMPDGAVVYGEKPVPGAARIDKIEPPPPKTGVTSLTPEEKARAEELARQRAAAAKAAAQTQNSIEDARKQLQQAEAARETGKEPLPTERIGVVGGGTRLTEAYFARQKNLEEAVIAARKRLEEAQRSAR